MSYVFLQAFPPVHAAIMVGRPVAARRLPGGSVGHFRRGRVGRWPPRFSSPADPGLERLDGFVAAELEDHAEPLLEQVGPVHGRVGLGDPRQLRGLPGGEVLGVLPQREAALKRLGDRLA
jgi:hypothetical protein